MLQRVAWQTGLFPVVVDDNSKLSEPLPLFGGGPLDRLMNRIGFGEYSRRQILRRTLLWISITWLPLLLFFIVSIVSNEPTPNVSFLMDFPVHVRFLVALPILIWAEGYVQARIGDVVPVLYGRGLLKPESAPLLVKAEKRVQALRDSVVAEVVLLLLSVGLVFSHAIYALPSEVISWRTLGTETATLAHGWYQGISMVVYHFLLFRWMWRYLLWFGFLIRLANLKLGLDSHHPDRMGGLSFVVPRHIKFGLVVLGVSSVASANLAALVFYAGTDVESFQLPVITYLFIVTLVFIGPLTAFTPLLVKTKREGLRSYGDFAARYAELFDSKWLGKGRKMEKNPLGAPDIQSLNDLGGSYDHLREMRLVLMNRKNFMGLMAFAVTPLLPLILFKIPLVEILKKLASSFI